MAECHVAVLPLAPGQLDSTYTLGSHALFQAALVSSARQAWQIGRGRVPGVAWLLLLLAVEVAVAVIAALLLRSGVVIAAWPEGRGDRGWSFILIAMAIGLAGVISNVAYLGLVLDRNRDAAARAREAQVAVAARRGAAGQHAAELLRTPGPGLQRRQRLCGAFDAAA
ncbi:MAG: hypothetical protein LH480_13285 [Rubrivivax sp.]|nr:hypothetical protein [Rubrivivax sp.]